MKVKQLLKVIDPIGVKVIIWGEDASDALWEGDLFDVPWWIAKLKIDNREDNGLDEPVSFYSYQNEYGAELIKMVIHVIDE